MYRQMGESLDVVNLLERNPVTKLSSVYQNKFINKIKNKFTESQQQIFVTSFYCYLNYHPVNDYVIDLDNVWEWLGYHQKNEAKRMFEKYFNIETDYKILLSRSAEQVVKTHGGHNKIKIMMNIRTFKLFCVKAGTKKADEIHNYFVDLEDILQDIVREENDELKTQLSIKDQELSKKNAKTKEEKESLREKTLLEQFPNNVECVYYGYIDNTNEDKEKLVKFGQSNGLCERVKKHKQTYINFRLVNAFRVENKQLIENKIKKHKILDKYRRNIIINGKTHTEFFALNGLTVTDLDKHINNIIKSCQYNPENYIKIIQENEELKNLNHLLKEENKKLNIENKKLLKNYKLNEVLKTHTSNVVHPASAATLLKRIAKSSDGFYHINGNNYKKLMGSREDVWNGIAYKTTGDLVKDDLMINKSGKIISKKKFIAEKNNNRFGKINEQKRINSQIRNNIQALIIEHD